MRGDAIADLAGFAAVDQPPPAGGPVPFVATINLNQQS